METLKDAALIAALIGVLIIFAMWVSLWDSVTALADSAL